jgi:hypothetical protein
MKSLNIPLITVLAAAAAAVAVSTHATNCVKNKNPSAYNGCGWGTSTNELYSSSDAKGANAITAYCIGNCTLDSVNCIFQYPASQGCKQYKTSNLYIWTLPANSPAYTCDNGTIYYTYDSENPQGPTVSKNAPVYEGDKTNCAGT